MTYWLACLVLPIISGIHISTSQSKLNIPTIINFLLFSSSSPHPPSSTHDHLLLPIPAHHSASSSVLACSLCISKHHVD